jgi:anti-anti-sigma regulatory factor
LGALVSLFVTRRNKGQTLALAGLTKNVMAVLQVAGLVKLLPIYSSVEEALLQKP